MWILLIFGVISSSWSLELVHQPHSIQKRQLDWNGKMLSYDHIAMSSTHGRNGRGRSVAAETDDDVSNSYDSSSQAGGLPGEPGIDYPVLSSIPLTGFHCRGRVPGYYGDTQTACQVFHVCEMSGRQDSFLCPNGTIFSQKLFACDWWYNVQCQSTQQHYRLNRNLFKGSNINLYGTPSFWNWLTEVEETYPVEQQVVPPPQAPPSLPDVHDGHHQRVEGARHLQYVPESLLTDDLSPGEVEEDEPPLWTNKQHFRWVDDTPSPQLGEDTVPELSWSDLSPNGPITGSNLPARDQPVSYRQGLVRRRKVRRRQHQNKLQEAQRELVPAKPKVVTKTTTTTTTTPKPKPVKTTTTAKPYIAKEDNRPQQYYYFDEASGTFKPVAKTLWVPSIITSSKQTSSAQSVQQQSKAKAINSAAVVPRAPKTVSAPAPPLKTNPSKTAVRSAKVLETSSAVNRPAPKVFKSAGHVNLGHPVMERVEPAFRPSKQIRPTNSLPTLPEERVSTSPKRKRTRQASSSAEYDPRLDRVYGQGHPILRMINWESTRV